jgi:deazaflavin-dependent oxidoreductase (nitroreductase family)
MTPTGPGVAGDDFCYLTTTGRRSGHPHEIEIWYATSTDGRTLYMLAGGRDTADWVRNLVADPACSVRVGDRGAPGRRARARIVAPTDLDDPIARTLVYEKYQPRYDGDLSNWRHHALPVAIELEDLIS